MEIEAQARGQWRLIINELPHGVSSKDIMEQLGEMAEPKLKKGEKDLNAKQKSLKQLTTDYIETFRDESGKDYRVRLVIEPRSSRLDQEQLIAFLLKNTSLECSVSLNVTAIGLDGIPEQKSIVEVLEEWTEFRTYTVTRRTQWRLDKVQSRIHILEGRLIAFLHIDKVIAVIRNADDPEADLMAQFNLTEIQAKDILEIRLRQLAKLEGFKIEKEVNDLKEEESQLKHLLSDNIAMRDQIISEIEADTAKFGDDRRTLIEEAGKIAMKAPTVADEPCTIILSKNGWIRQRQGHDIDLSTISFKDGDALLSAQKTRTVNPIILIDTKGRAYTLSSADVPGGRSDGVPVASLVEIQPKAKVAAMIAAPSSANYLFASSGGYGFIANIKDLESRQKAGKAFMKLEDSDTLLNPVNVHNGSLIASLCSNGKLLAFPIDEMKQLSGGKGIIIQGTNDGESLLSIASVPESGMLKLTGTGRGGKSHEQVIKWVDLQPFVSHRARKGLMATAKFPASEIIGIIE